MGYKAKRKIYVITDWPDEDMTGLVVKARSVKLRAFLEMGKDMTDAKAVMAENTEEGVEAVDGLLGMFAKSLVDWNLEDDEGSPVPATLEGLLDQDNEFAMRIVFTWMQIIGGAPGPLDQRSIGGGTSLAASLPMEPLSSSRAS